ncbi:MAG: methyl-branched lipid omega-hydroxylase [Ilumatobacteraceae bacterium]|jgi:hypothetical protein
MWRAPHQFEGRPLPKGPGYWAITRHEDVWAASRNPQVFTSGRGVNIGDVPQEMNEFIGSMIAMDDPRHFRLRNIVAKEYVGSFEQLLGVLFEMFVYAQKLGEDRRADPEDDIASVLMHAEVDGERLTPQEFGSFFILLVVAGNETTRNAIAHGMKMLTDFPDQRRSWFDDYQGYVKTAVDEIVRCATPRHPLPSNRLRRHRHPQHQDRRGPEGRALVQLGQPRRDGVRQRRRFRYRAATSAAASHPSPTICRAPSSTASSACAAPKSTKRYPVRSSRSRCSTSESFVRLNVCPSPSSIDVNLVIEA